MSPRWKLISLSFLLLAFGTQPLSRTSTSWEEDSVSSPFCVLFNRRPEKKRLTSQPSCLPRTSVALTTNSSSIPPVDTLLTDMPFDILSPEEASTAWYDDQRDLAEPRRINELRGGTTFMARSGWGGTSQLFLFFDALVDLLTKTDLNSSLFFFIQRTTSEYF